MLFEVETIQNIHGAYRIDASSECNCWKCFWHKYVLKGDFSLRNMPWTGFSVVFNNDLFLSEYNRNIIVMVKEFIQKLNSGHLMVYCYLHFGKVPVPEKRFPYN